VAPLASLRGDFGRIVLEEGSNVQDACVLHSFPGIDTVVEVNGHVGHAAVLHACRIGRNALVGMNAVVMDHAEVGEGSIIAAAAFVKAEMKIPPGVLVAGVPAKVLRELTEQERKWKVIGTDCYQNLARRSLASLKPCEPLREGDRERARFEMPDVMPLSDARRRAG
ncbi:MAG TPA: phenylacetic acid degradation protein PaaY, partial [Thauera aminoaromatica]|nr:phenylacetic acid degradation protein PaaY [Thauera aminoaromatica]